MEVENVASSLMARHADELVESQGPRGDHDDIEELYARAVDLYSSLTNESSMYPGENYRRLASFLGRPYSGGLMKHLWSGVPPHNPFPFVVLRRHGQQDGASASSTRISFDCGPDGLDAFRATRRISGDMLFLQGTASPEWLNLVGANYGVDPEFFRRHTDSQQPPLYFDLPSLQSSSINIVNLPLTSIGRWGTPMPSHLDLSAERRASKVGSRSVFPPARSTPVGTSIVRQYIILSSEYFAVEQIASVHVHVSKSGSWIAVVWSDCGRCLTQTSTGRCWWDPCNEMHRSNSSILTVHQYQPKMFVNRPADASTPAVAAGTKPRPPLRPDISPQGGAKSRLLQSPSLLPKHYGQDLDRETARDDGLYALSELFTFCAFSESQFLNLVGHMIDEEGDALDRSIGLDKRTTLNLEFYKRILGSHLKNLKSILSCIEAGGGRTWPRAQGKNQREIADAMTERLKGDYSELIHRAEALSQRCIDESFLLMNKTMIEDNQRGLSQAQAMARLTMLAYFFVPLSFTASFFGMNFRELVGPNGPLLSVWVWFLVTIPVLVLAIMLYFRTQVQFLYACVKKIC